MCVVMDELLEAEETRRSTLEWRVNKRNFSYNHTKRSSWRSWRWPQSLAFLEAWTILMDGVINTFNQTFDVYPW